MKWNRREFIVASSVGVVGASYFRAPLVAQQREQPPIIPEFTALRGQVGTFTARGGTIGWLVAPEAVVVIDSQFPDTAQMFLDGLKERTSRRIDVLVNTHHHGDHTAGNKVFQPVVERVVAHANVPGLQRRQAAERNIEAEQVYPDTTFDDSWSLDAGGEMVTAKHYGPGHTGGDITIFFERANVVHMGDLMFNARHPRVDRPGGASIRNWILLLEQVVSEHNSDTMYIFGHAKPGMPITGTRADLLAFRDYFTALLEYVQIGISAGKSVDEITQVEQVPGFSDYSGAPIRTVQMAYQELMAQ
jgi:cyclase